MKYVCYLLMIAAVCTHSVRAMTDVEPLKFMLERLVYIDHSVVSAMALVNKYTRAAVKETTAARTTWMTEFVGNYQGLRFKPIFLTFNKYGTQCGFIIDRITSYPNNGWSGANVPVSNLFLCRVAMKGCGQMPRKAFALIKEGIKEHPEGLCVNGIVDELHFKEHVTVTECLRYGTAECYYLVVKKPSFDKKYGALRVAVDCEGERSTTVIYPDNSSCTLIELC